MKAESLREVIRAQPFRPFSLTLVNGERLPVPHPEWVWLLPAGRTIGWSDQDERVKLQPAIGDSRFMHGFARLPLYHALRRPPP